MTNYVIAASLDWFRNHPKNADFLNLKCHEITNKDALTVEYLDSLRPRYVFFTHWSWMVPSDIYDRYECIVFHTAPLPYGRGGSPIQNLIVRGIKRAPVCALRMTGDLDGGPIYDSEEISLEGTIEEIFARIAGAVERLIVSICKNHPIPRAQVGEPVYFKRLTPRDNEISSDHSLEQLYDRIRMVDGLNYPRAYIKFGRFTIAFTNARLENEKLRVNATISENNQENAD